MLIQEAPPPSVMTFHEMIMEVAAEMQHLTGLVQNRYNGHWRVLVGNRWNPHHRGGDRSEGRYGVASGRY